MGVMGYESTVLKALGFLSFKCKDGLPRPIQNTTQTNATTSLNSTTTNVTTNVTTNSTTVANQTQANKTLNANGGGVEIEEDGVVGLVAIIVGVVVGVLGLGVAAVVIVVVKRRKAKI